MAHGLSLELAKIKAPEWRLVDPAKVAEEKDALKHSRRSLPKKTRNKMWKKLKSWCDERGLTRHDMMKQLEEKPKNVSVQDPSN